jgi:hypothetical protein
MLGKWVAKLVAHLSDTAALGVRIQDSLKNTKWPAEAKEWPTYSGPPQKKFSSTVIPSFFKKGTI